MSYSYDDSEYDNFASGPMNEALSPCNVCGRTFLPETLVKHEKICAKNATSKGRKVFQSGKQRALGSDVPMSNILKSGVPPPAKPEIAKKSNWREKHAEFINNIRAAKGVQEAMKNGDPLPPPPPPTINPDYVQCPVCERRFSEKAAERHIAFCSEKGKRISEKKITDAAAQRRMEARLKYKPAKPKPKNREEAYYNQSNNSSNTSNGYGSPMRTGKTEKNYHAGLAMRSSSLDRRKGSGEKPRTIPRMNSHESVSKLGREANRDHSNMYSPSPPGSGRPPSGSYQHRSRGNSAKTDGRIGKGYSDTQTRVTNSNNRNNHHASYSGRFCHDCGFKYCRNDAHFCCECGTPRLGY